jgi:serine/threonine protein kinase
VGVEIDGYTIEKKLGTGSIASVYLAINLATGEQVALKVHIPELSNDPEFQKHFLTYSSSVRTLSHKNYLTIYEVGVSNGHCFIAMQYIDVAPLSQNVLSQQRAKDQLIQLTQEIANALGYLHDQGFVHRRTKLSNLFLLENGHVILSEVEIARGIIENEATHLVKDTIVYVRYVSPERIQGRKSDNRTDFYCFGLTLFELLLGSLPYESEDPEEQRRLHLEGEIPKLPAPNQRYQTLIDQLLAKNPQYRIATNKQFLNVARESGLLAAKHSFAQAATVASTPPEASPVAEKKSSALVPALVVGGVAIAGAIFFLGQSDKTKLKNTTEETTQSPSEPYNFDGDTGDEVIVPTVDMAQVNALLAKAKEQVDSGNRVSPEGNNAYESYQSVLELVANDEAESGLQEISQYYYQQALNSKELGNFAESQRYIDLGRSRFPLDTGLLFLNETVKAGLEKVEAENRAIEQKVQKIVRLKEQVEVHIKRQELTSPPGDNAFTAYQQLSALEPQAKWVEQGALRIANEFAALAQDSLQKKNFSDGMDLAREGLQILPTHAELKKLNQDLQVAFEQQLADNKQQAELDKRKREAAKKKAKISALLKKAHRQFSANKLTSPGGDNVAETFKTIMEIDPSNGAARDGFNQIADQYLALAKSRSQKDIQKSIDMIDRGLQIMPLHAGLNAYRSTLVDEKIKQDALNKRRNDQERAIQALVSQADKQFAAKRYTSPAGDNAFETYQRIQTIASKDKRVQRGFEKIAGAYLKLAKQKMANNEYKRSHVYVRKGLSILPGYQPLLSFKSSLAKQQKTYQADQLIKKQLSHSAQLLLTAKKQIQAEDANVVNTYNELKKMQGASRQVRDLKESINKMFIKQVRASLYASQYKNALQEVRSAIRFSPDDNALLSLRDRVTAEIAKQRKESNRANQNVVAPTPKPDVIEPEKIELDPANGPESLEPPKMKNFGTF